ncbi:hypothetical protein [Aliarcobacter butzleri]|uniref:hypothetical protein n=1 Tax=Aliarcobacter butzleri TaxID=28197 RepID=UPI001D17E82B|nr:hypothetical protein [Aliarcobacter butzleri]
MKNRLFFLIFLSINLFADENLAQKLIKAYPDFLKEYSNNQIIWNDDTKMIFDEKKEYKSHEDRLNNASLKEQLTTKYIKVKENKNYIPNFNEDAGRARFEPFFQKMYGKTQKEVEKNLVKIKWLPKSQNKDFSCYKNK